MSENLIANEQPHWLFFSNTQMPKEALNYMNEGKSVTISRAIVETVSISDNYANSVYSDYINASKEVDKYLRGSIDSELPLGDNLFTHIIIYDLVNVIQRNTAEFFGEYHLGNSSEWALLGAYGDITGGRLHVSDFKSFNNKVTLSKLVESMVMVLCAHNFVTLSDMDKIKEVLGKVVEGNKLKINDSHSTSINVVSTDPLN